MATLFNNVANTNTINYVPVQATFSASGGFLTFIGPGGVPFTVNGSLAINTTAITGGTSGRVLYDNAGTVGEKAVTGTGNVVLDSNPVFATDITVIDATLGRGKVAASTNLGFGVSVLSAITTGIDNVAIGDYALSVLDKGSYNTAVGTYALYNAKRTINNLANNNCALGAGAGQALISGDDNICIGYSSISNLTSGNGNIAIGSNSGLSIATGSNNVYIGTNTPLTVNDSTNEIVIGNTVNGSGSNTVTIGNDSITATQLKGVVSASTFQGTVQDSSEASFRLANNPTLNQYVDATQTTGTFTIGGPSATGAITLGQSTAAQTVNIATGVTAASTTKAVNIGTAGNSTSTTNITIGATTGTSTTTVNGYFKPPALASAPTYVKGAVYFDTTLNKLRVGGATTWETITSV